MDNMIELVSDGSGLAVLGRARDVEHFLRSEGLLSKSIDMARQRLGSALQLGAVAGQTASAAMASSGRWLKLTEESAALYKKYDLMDSKVPGIKHAMLGKPGDVKRWLQVEDLSTNFTNPAMLANAAGMLAQLAVKHELGEIKGYLERIDLKVESVLRAQKDAEVSKVIGAGFDIDSAMAVLERDLRIDDDTWSTVQGRTQTISDALGWVLLRLDAIAQELDAHVKPGALADAVPAANAAVRELLAVAARCFELQDALDILRLDRAAQRSLEEAEGRRLTLADDRRTRREAIERAIGDLVVRVDAAAERAGGKIVLHLSAHRTVVSSTNDLVGAVTEFLVPLGFEFARDVLESTRWLDALKDPQQVKAAAKEAGRYALTTAGTAGALALSVVAVRMAAHNEEDQAHSD